VLIDGKINIFICKIHTFDTNDNISVITVMFYTSGFKLKFLPTDHIYIYTSKVHGQNDFFLLVSIDTKSKINKINGDKMYLFY